MKSLFRKVLNATLASLLVCSGCSTAYADIIHDAWGVVTDPLKLQSSSKELSSSLERTLIQLASLESQTNYDVQQRLEQIRSIVKEALEGTQATIDRATLRMLQLESTVNKDAVKLIYRAQCATEVVLMDQLQRSFVQLISDLKKANPGVKIFGITIFNLSVNDIKIDKPDQAYNDTKNAVFEVLRSSVSDSSKAYAILSAYQNLERAAQFTRCYYIDQALEERWVEEVNELERISQPWVTVVTPTM